MCRYTIIFFLLFINNFKSKNAKVIALDLKIPFNGKAVLNNGSEIINEDVTKLKALETEKDRIEFGFGIGLNQPTNEVEDSSTFQGQDKEDAAFESVSESDLVTPQKFPVKENITVVNKTKLNTVKNKVGDISAPRSTEKYANLIKHDKNKALKDKHKVGSTKYDISLVNMERKKHLDNEHINVNRTFADPFKPNSSVKHSQVITENINDINIMKTRRYQTQNEHTLRDNSKNKRNKKSRHKSKKGKKTSREVNEENSIKNDSSDENDIRAVKKILNDQIVSVKQADKKQKKEKHTAQLRRRIWNVLRSEPISEDIVDAAAQINDEKDVEMVNRDGLALYDLRMQVNLMK